jgi:fibronectin type 3 domain-containing protein
MKNKKLIVLFGMLVMVLIFGMMVVGCGDENGDPTSPRGQNPGGENPGGTTIPSVPTGVSATAQSASSISVSWNAVSGTTSYEVYYEIGSSSIKNLAATVTETSYIHTGLQASTTYYYYIKAVNSAGSSDYSSYVSAASATTQSSGGSGTIPNTPTGVSATTQSSSSIHVSWSSVSGAISYEVYYEIGSSTTKNLAGTVSGTSYTHTGLQASTTYYYYLKAVNSAGSSGYSSYASATTQSSGSSGETPTIPSAPTGVTATAQSSTSIRISWNAVSGATSYKIYRNCRVTYS